MTKAEVIARIEEARRLAQGVTLTADELSLLFTVPPADDNLPEAPKQAPKRDPIKVQIRWGIRRDLAQVLRIESLSFPTPWSEADFSATLKQRNTIIRVAEFDEQIVGFLIYELNRERAQIANLAVHPDYRRCHIGTQLVEVLLGRVVTGLSAHSHREAIRVDVRERNLPAQLFFKSLGFSASRVVRGGFLDTGEDAYCFERKVNSEVAP